jgi:type III restriction enzyme
LTANALELLSMGTGNRMAACTKDWNRMTQVVIENPIINSPFEEPRCHFRFTDRSITNEVVDGRRTSSYFMPIARLRKRRVPAPKQLFETQWTQDRFEENKLVNQIRPRVALWRARGYAGVTPTTARLMQYWTDRSREKRFFFCQNEALETAIYITEVAGKYGDAWIENELRGANDTSNPGLPRMAFKMATGSGKTVVMAMLIAWQTLNKRANPPDARFSDTFLIVTPGITIRDRLRVLLPNDPENYYRQRDIVPAQYLEQLGQAKIIITNFHAFGLRERSQGSLLTRLLSGQAATGINKETPDQMVRRVCRELRAKKRIIVLNDEAHHCYRRKPDGVDEPLTGEERVEAKRRDEEARIWISGIEAVKAKIGLKAIYDLSATPFFLRGSGWPEGTLFPWVISDFSLIDAIEAGIVKVPREPAADDSWTGGQPTCRDLWLRIRDRLPRKGRKADAESAEPNLPAELQGALQSLYGNYEKYYRQWEQNAEARARGITPPVFVVVCSNTNVSKLVFDFIAGWEKRVGEQAIVQTGQLPRCRNDDGRGGWLQRPNTILVDSRQLESGEAMSADFKKIAARQIEEFKADYRSRFPGRDADSLTDEDLLREVMNTVGKAGKLGEHIRCVVSVSMLTEGWDANTVTHILGVRAFDTQLLCEQVIGRALRRMSYAVNGCGRFEPEYAEVYGVPFSFIPCSGAAKEPRPGLLPTRVRALENRIGGEITFPRVLGYRCEVLDERLTAAFTRYSQLTLSTTHVASGAEKASIVGQAGVHTLDNLKRRRPSEMAFFLAKLTLEKYFRDGEGTEKPWLFPQLLGITKRWLAECVTLKDNTFPHLLLLLQFAHDAADRIYNAIAVSTDETGPVKPLLRPYDTIGSTRYVDFDTVCPVYATRADKCHLSHIVAGTDSWARKLAETLEEMPEVVRYVRNHNLGFAIPYTVDGEERHYDPDFLVGIDDGDGSGDLLNLILEISGGNKKDKAAMVATARSLWVPAVNNDGRFGRWAFIEVADPWDAKKVIRGWLS